MQTVHLQGIGEVPAVPAGELEVGDVTLWNSGVKETILSIEPSKSGKTFTAEIETPSGYRGTRRLSVTRLVARVSR